MDIQARKEEALSRLAARKKEREQECFPESVTIDEQVKLRIDINRKAALEKREEARKQRMIEEELAQAALYFNEVGEEEDFINEEEEAILSNTLENRDKIESVTYINLKCASCDNPIIYQVYFDAFKVQVCFECSKEKEEYHLISKTIGLEKYLLTDKDIKGSSP